MPVHMATNLIENEPPAKVTQCGARLPYYSRTEVATVITESSDCDLCWDALRTQQPVLAEQLWRRRHDMIEAWSSDDRRYYRIPLAVIARIRDHFHTEHDGMTLRIVGAERFDALWQELNTCAVIGCGVAKLNKEQALHLLVWEELWGWCEDESGRLRNPHAYFQFLHQFDHFYLNETANA